MTSTPRDPALDFSEWLHAELVAAYANEIEPWATERVNRVMARLNACREGAEPFEAVILWISRPWAFTTVGRYVYISRQLLERLPSDDAAAYVLAHEIGHHDCGHLRLFGEWADWLPRWPGAAYAAAVMRLLELKAYGPEREAEADGYAVELCQAAGYDGDLCLKLFDILENMSLDRGDYDGVFGPENLLDPTDPQQGSVAYQIQRWAWTRARGYLPLRERRERARAWLERCRRGTRHPAPAEE